MNAPPRTMESTAGTLLAVPAESVHVAWLALPARNAVQARAAAHALLSREVATPPDTLHVAIADEADGDGNRLVVGVDRPVLQRWLDDARAAGIDPVAVVPDCLLLPPPASGDDAVHVLRAGDRWLVRGPGIAFAAEPSLAGRLLGDHATIEVGDDALANGARSPAVNLLQGAFADTPERPAGGRRIRWLAAAVLAMPLLVPAATAARHAWAAHGLEATARSEATAVLGTAAEDPLAATDAHLARLAGADALPRAVSALAAAIAARPGIHLETLRQSPADGLVVGVVHGGPADLAALDAGLREAGFALAIVDERRAADGRQRTDLQLETRR